MRGKLAIEVASQAQCDLVRSGTEAEIVRHQFKPHPQRNTPGAPDYDDVHSDCGECHVELAATDDRNCADACKQPAYIVSQRTSNCVCPIVDAHDCLAEIEAIRGQTVVLTVTAPNRAAFRDLIADLRTVATSVTVKRLINGGNSEQTRTLEIEQLTPKRREAVETAVEMGYYKSPKETDLDELAAHLDITKSAVSQRLKAVERHLITSLNEE